MTETYSILPFFFVSRPPTQNCISENISCQSDETNLPVFRRCLVKLFAHNFAHWRLLIYLFIIFQILKNVDCCEYSNDDPFACVSHSAEFLTSFRVVCYVIIPNSLRQLSKNLLRKLKNWNLNHQMKWNWNCMDFTNKRLLVSSMNLRFTQHKWLPVISRTFYELSH